MQKIGSIPNTRADSNGEFTDGNVAGGVPPTILPAEWFNTIQRELINILAAAGITPDSKKFDQMALAISTLVSKGEFLKIKNNLSEIKAAGPSAVAAAIANLGLTDTAATAAGALQKTQNLNDVANKAIALTNLGALPSNGTAVAATKLATARTIAGKSFDGTANIAIGAADVGALPLSGGTLSGPLEITGVHALLVGPNGYKSNILTGANGAITNSGGTGIGLNADKGIYFWNDNTGYAMTLSPTSLSVNRPINISNVVGAAFSIRSKNESDVCYIMSVSDTPTKSKWYMGNTKENDTTLHIVNSKTSSILSIGDTISSSAPFLAPTVTSDGNIKAGAATYGTNGDINGAVWGGSLLDYIGPRVRAWAAVRGDGSIISSYGFSSINRTNVGGYNFVMSRSNANYAVSVGINGGTQNGALSAHSANIWNRTPNSFSIQNANDSGTQYNWIDWPEFYVIVVGQ
ncbi:hypothetical protein [Yersinia kristensenii]|uniref:Tail fibre protein gp37 trimerization region domain-containing protein n=2 Tax=Yersinia kristensenii TaxID=28152 RepID=A0AB73NYM3_YERKR|nr:hypothetical protein [Yersinia kristensenii]OVZ81331.1 hypothetical protein CBW52_09595 [Yersinia kristensenii]